MLSTLTSTPPSGNNTSVVLIWIGNLVPSAVWTLVCCVSVTRESSVLSAISRRCHEVARRGRRGWVVRIEAEHIQRGIVTIPKSVRRERMEQNFEVFDFELTADEMTRIRTLDTGASMFFDHRDPDRVSWLNSRTATA
jgi:hypothetical protein